MNNLNYIFFEEFKHLDKLCCELYKAQSGITHYIDDMKLVSVNDYQYIPNWKEDLEQLIRVRHIRNYLAHEGTFNEETCTQNDIDWICVFHQRILNQSDPIAMLYQMSKAKKQTPKQFHINNQASKIIKEQSNNLINGQDNILTKAQSNRLKKEQSISLIEEQPDKSINEQRNEKITTSDKILLLFIIAAAFALIIIYGIAVLE